MSRIKLKNLLNLTEQAPQPPMGDPLAPAAAPIAPPLPGMNAGGQDQQQTPPATPDTSPEPEDPGEYDFTKDFREFEDKKNKAEADAKKVLMDKMNERLLGKTIVANASRGYGQPKTDYTIKAVKKISVEFWYKDYVVIAADENDKKYFLTPGINIKIEGSEPAPGSEPPAETGQEQPPVPNQPIGGQPDDKEAPNGAAPQQSPPQEPVSGEPQQGVKQQTPEPQSKQPAVPPQPEEQPQQEPPVEDPKKKKKVPPVAEWVQEDLNKFLLEFMSDDIKNRNGKVNFIGYIQEVSKMLAEGLNSTKIKVKLLIPENHMVNVDNREIKLAAVDAMRQKTHFGQYSKGSINVNKNGRYYLLEYIKEIGWSN